MTKKYLPKRYFVGSTEELPIRGYEARKIVNRIRKETMKPTFWNLLPFILLVAFVIWTIIVLAGQL